MLSSLLSCSETAAKSLPGYSGLKFFQNMLAPISCLRKLLKMKLKITAQDESSLLRYIETTEQIQLHHNRSVILRHRLLFYLAVYKAAYYAFLSADIFSVEQRTVAYNAFYQLTADRGTNLFAGFFAVMLAYHQHQYYFVGNRPMNRLLVDVLHRRRYDFFLTGRRQGGGGDLGEYIRHFYLVMVNGAQAFVLTNCESICFLFCFCGSLFFTVSE